MPIDHSSTSHSSTDWHNEKLAVSAVFFTYKENCLGVCSSNMIRTFVNKIGGGGQRARDPQRLQTYSNLFIKAGFHSRRVIVLSE